MFEESKKSATKIANKKADTTTAAELAAGTINEGPTNLELLQGEEEEANTAMSVIDGSGFDALMDNLENTDIKEMQEVTGAYLDFNTFKAGEKRVYVFTGMTTFTKPDTGEVIAAVNLVDKNRANFICASAIVVNSLSKITVVPCGVALVVNGKEKSPKGSYWKVNVYVL